MRAKSCVNLRPPLRTAAAVIILASCLLAYSAPAQPAYRSILAAFGQCKAKENPALAREFILINLAYVPPERFLKLSNSDCMGSVRVDLHRSPLLMRYVLADALVKMDLQSFDPMVLRTAAPLAELVVDPAAFDPSSNRAADLAETDKAIASARNELAYIKYGECVVRSEPSNAKRLLDSKVDSAAENSAFGELMPVFQACLNKGQQFTASRLPLRGVVAFNYYRLAYSPRQPAAITP